MFACKGGTVEAHYKVRYWVSTAHTFWRVGKMPWGWEPKWFCCHTRLREEREDKTKKSPSLYLWFPRRKEKIKNREESRVSECQSSHLSQTESAWSVNKKKLRDFQRQDNVQFWPPVTSQQIAIEHRTCCTGTGNPMCVDQLRPQWRKVIWRADYLSINRFLKMY